MFHTELSFCNLLVADRPFLFQPSEGPPLMRVLFLNPPFHARFSREQRSPAVTKSGTLYYPKWLSHAAGVAIKNGHEVDLVDAPAAGASVQAVIDRISAKNIDAVVCDTSTPSIIND